MIARVTLEIALNKDFDYLVPKEMEAFVQVGVRVQVPFGRRKVSGCVTGLPDRSDYPLDKIKPIDKILGEEVLITPQVLQLSRWLATYYCCPLEIALKSVVPVSVRREQEGWRRRLFVKAIETRDPVVSLTARQKEVLECIREAGRAQLQEIIRKAHTTQATVKRLEDRGLVTILSEIDERDPYGDEVIIPTEPLSMNIEQQAAFEQIVKEVDSVELSEDSEEARSPEVIGAGSTFLLHGVTGSGKTEIYLQAIAHALEKGKGAIVLVPEISLTPQTVERFKARFCSGKAQTLVAVLHSHLSNGERHDEWHKIREGRARIVIGARSAVFAPVHPLGLIIVDEEHETSYKQGDSPRYHARDVAVMRGAMEKTVVVLGSATPSLESYHNALMGKYRLLRLTSRVDDIQMPVVRVMDMRMEFRKNKNREGTPVLSGQLREAIINRLEKREQTLLFLNRRGFATSLQCPQCGWVATCPDCSVSLTYHRSAQQLKCHICGHVEAAPEVCRTESCRNPGIRFSGLGTEKVEDILHKLFPKARIRRMDSDSLKRKEDYRIIFNEFRTGKIDILLGTQMIAKGLHFPNVTLVGIIQADLSLHFPDFRASERTFQLLTQVAGRAGRGSVEGEVFVQSFTPFHPAVQFARRHDFEGFYEEEIGFRQELFYPPIHRAAMLTLKGKHEEFTRVASEHLKRVLEKELRDFDDLKLSGPAPSPLAKAETFYRYQIILRTARMTRLSRCLSGIKDKAELPKDISLIIDIDPVNMF